MNVNSVNNVAAYTATTNTKTYTKSSNDTSTTTDNSGVVYEKGTNTSSKTIYAKEDVVARLKADADSRTAQLKSLVEKMMSQQGVKIGEADDMWKFLASGDYTVTPEVKAQAQADIADDGYWGVEQTSDRIIEFAKALVGDDPDKAESMRAAFEKGFKAATKAWGKDLPDISQKTYDAVMKKFDDWAGVNKDDDTKSNETTSTETK
ncbi:MAG: hypothetical protein GX284_01010 [Clostridiales bacterium]|uniref:hypothetical protein n=1 Tax=Roseburia sp. MSJ-14 TaxID=2841514 RepID=UPI0016A84A1A|nr:hypothetical protein [Roseburia sp. MSJ-14]MBU5473675.1 hypothetical protein [Roseburia sp. MSJ-14]NLK76304.1 hypothetical protein [Clostridiales bacterium]